MAAEAQVEDLLARLKRLELHCHDLTKRFLFASRCAYVDAASLSTLEANFGQLAADVAAVQRIAGEIAGPRVLPHLQRLSRAAGEALNVVTTCRAELLRRGPTPRES